MRCHKPLPVCMLLNQTSDQTFTHPLPEAQNHVCRNWASEFVVCITSGQSLVCGSCKLCTVALAAAAGLSCFPGSCSLLLHWARRTQSSPASALNTHFIHTRHRRYIRCLISNAHLFPSSSLAPHENICKLLVPPRPWTAFSCDFVEVCLFKSVSKSLCMRVMQRTFVGLLAFHQKPGYTVGFIITFSILEIIQRWEQSLLLNLSLSHIQTHNEIILEKQ